MVPGICPTSPAKTLGSVSVLVQPAGAGQIRTRSEGSSSGFESSADLIGTGGEPLIPFPQYGNRSRAAATRGPRMINYSCRDQHGVVAGLRQQPTCD
jgi:hypothetical protein